MDYRLIPLEGLAMEIDAARKLMPMQASKWLKHQILIDAEDMQNLFQNLGDFALYQTSGVCPLGEGNIPKPEFLDCYANYISALKQGQLPDETPLRKYFTAAMSVTEEALFAVPVGEKEQVVRIKQPIVQLQYHRFDYSDVDHQFRSMVYGVDSISWGIQFSYPQLYQNAKTKEVQQVSDSPEFPNTQLFRQLQKWIRHHTVATPFVVEGVRTNVPIRLGKNCFSWINRHPQLLKKKISVVEYVQPEN